MSAETFLRGLSDEKIRSKVLMTTRLFPRVLEGADNKILKACREENLKAFSPEDAVMYFHNEGIAATRAEIIEVCSAYGYHPLSLSLLVGLINENEEHRGDIVVARNLDIFGDIKAKRDHVLKRAYESLSPERRDLLSKISCFRGSMEYATIKKVFDNPDFEKSLIDLRKRGLLQYVEETKRYDMHPIVRHYAYEHFTDVKARQNTHLELAMHFIDVMPVTNTNVKTLEDLAPVIELYHHMVRAGNLDEARKMYYERMQKVIYFQFGAYQLQIELLRALFLDGEDKPPRLKREDAQAGTLNDLAAAYSNSGQPRRAVPLIEMQIAIREKRGVKESIAIGLGNLAQIQLVIGALSAAERNQQRAIELCKEIENEFQESVHHQELGRVLSYRGAWQKAEQELEISTKYWEKTNDHDGLCIDGCYRSLLYVLRKNKNAAVVHAQKALDAWKKDAETTFPKEGTHISTLWLLSAAYRANDDLMRAEENLTKALNLCRQINAVDTEADILLELAKLFYSRGDFKDAQEKASEALTITERSGYVLQGADVNLFLAQYALEQEKDKAKAKQYAEEAKKLAMCDGPPYYYKVAYEEAERMVEKLKE
jgi:tetratricopeptide (TPR) repeat protein